MHGTSTMPSLRAASTRERFQFAAAPWPVQPIARQHGDEQRGGGDRLLDQRLELIAALDAAGVAPQPRARLAELGQLIAQLLVEIGDEPLDLVPAGWRNVVVARVGDEDLDRQGADPCSNG
jgi:hypothetical protein